MSARTLTPSRIRRRALLRRAWFEALAESGRFVMPFFMGGFLVWSFQIAPLKAMAREQAKVEAGNYSKLIKACQQ